MSTPTSSPPLPQQPKFSDLPLDKEGGKWNAWGLYGKKDELGMLRRLTDRKVVESAREEIRTGVRISLNWPLDAQGTRPLFSRQAFHKHVYQKPPRIVHDDVWTFNTQSSSQWDGLRHFGYQKLGKFYNGVTVEEISGEGATNVNGIHVMAEKGIVGRAILLDFHSWRIANNIAYEPFKTGSIPLKYLKATAEAQGTEIKFGDICLIRSGFTVAHSKLTADDIEVEAAKVPPEVSGVEQSEEMIQWIWENFSAIGGDQPSLECWPTQKDWSLHEVLLAGWGCPIGELFDLELLARHCKEVNRWSFFLASEPCNVPGGVARYTNSRSW
ncbi:MAG: hypothetical protein M1834_003983 [Cirrosporium novae-zelandiae]|nr:MAG: hypothetical protein M1834_003983 [Cirrosporium novae-zelandiae]